MSRAKGKPTPEAVRKKMQEAQIKRWRTTPSMIQEARDRALRDKPWEWKRRRGLDMKGLKYDRLKGPANGAAPLLHPSLPPEPLPLASARPVNNDKGVEDTGGVPW